MRTRRVICWRDTVSRLIVPLLLLLVAPPLVAQGTGRVSGTVTESADGRPISGVNIVIKGTHVGTLSSDNGRYSVAAGPTDTLVFRFIGYAPQEIAISGRARRTLSIRRRYWLAL